MSRLDSAYDITLDGYGFMLARKEQLGQGGMAWQVTGVGSSITRRSTLEQSYGNQEAVIEAPMVWGTAEYGYGSELHREGMYRYAVNVDCRFSEQITNGPLVESVGTGTGIVRSFCEQAGALYALIGADCKAIASDGTVTISHTLDSDAVYGTPEMIVTYDGCLYIGNGYTIATYVLHKRSAAGVWTDTASSEHPKYMAAFRDRVWANTAKNQVRCVSGDPMTLADWSGAYDIGDPGTTITGLAELGDMLFIAKTDGLYALGSDGIANQLLPELRFAQSSTNGLGMYAWHNMLFVPHVRGLLIVGASGNTAMVASCQPGVGVSSDNPVRGTITAMAGSGKWLYAGLYTPAGDSYLLAGRERGENEPGTGPMTWHPIAKLTGKQISALYLTSVFTYPRLMIGTADGYMYGIYLPTNSENPREDSNCKFATSGSLYFAPHSWNAPTTDKVWKSIEVDADNLTTSRYLSIYYNIDKLGWVDAGDLVVGKHEYLSLGTDGVSGRSIELRVDFTCPDSITPIVVRSISVIGAERPRILDMITVQIRCADKVAKRNGQKDTHDAEDLLNKLRLLTRQDRIVTLVDVVGASRTVMVLPPLEESMTQQTGDLSPEIIATVRMIDTDPTRNLVAAYWDVDYWDGGKVWET